VSWFFPFVSDPKSEPQAIGARINLTYGRRSSVAYQYPACGRARSAVVALRCSPGGVETKTREYFMPEFGQMRIAAMAGIGSCVDDFSPDLRRTFA
jgi:hypothetical protein